MFLKSLSLIDADIDGDSNIDADDVRAVTPQTARVLFRKHFWDIPRLGGLPPLIALITYCGGKCRNRTRRCGAATGHQQPDAGSDPLAGIQRGAAHPQALHGAG